MRFPSRLPALNPGLRSFGNCRSKARVSTKARRLFSAASTIRSFSNPRSTERWPIHPGGATLYSCHGSRTRCSLQTIIFKDTGIAELALQTLSRRRLGKATRSPARVDIAAWGDPLAAS